MQCPQRSCKDKLPKCCNGPPLSSVAELVDSRSEMELQTDAPFRPVSGGPSDPWAAAPHGVGGHTRLHVDWRSHARSSSLTKYQQAERSSMCPRVLVPMGNLDRPRVNMSIGRSKCRSEHACDVPCQAGQICLGGLLDRQSAGLKSECAVIVFQLVFLRRRRRGDASRQTKS